MDVKWSSASLIVQHWAALFNTLFFLLTEANPYQSLLVLSFILKKYLANQSSSPVDWLVGQVVNSPC